MQTSLQIVIASAYKQKGQVKEMLLYQEYGFYLKYFDVDHICAKQIL